MMVQRRRQWILFPTSVSSAGYRGVLSILVLVIVPTAFAFTSSLSHQEQQRIGYDDGKSTYSNDDSILENGASNCPCSRRRRTTGLFARSEERIENDVLELDFDKVSTDQALASVKVGDLLGDLPTPTLLLELSLAERALNNTSSKFDSLDDLLSNIERATTLETNNGTSLLDGSLFVHTTICDTSERDEIDASLGSGKSPSIGRVDVGFISGGAYLGIGVSNHHVGGYYWARGMGMGASLEAHGVGFCGVSTNADAYDGIGELYWRKRSPSTANDVSNSNNENAFAKEGDTTETSSNSNDGKRSEWADFLSRGDTVQLVPYNATSVLLENSGFRWILGIRREGRPLGADPIVERIWKRDDPSSSRGSWVLVAP